MNEFSYDGDGPIVFLDLKGTASIGLDADCDLFVATDSCVAALALVHQAVPDMKVVVTSDMRRNDAVICRLGSFLRRAGMARETVVDITPFGAGRRGDEIASWLEAHPQVKRFAIVDDSEVRRADGQQVDRVVYVDSAVGLAAADVPGIISMLKN